MHNMKQTLQQDSLNILSKAAEIYVASLDELGRSFVGPQIQAALAHLDELIKEAHPVPVEEQAPLA